MVELSEAMEFQSISKGQESKEIRRVKKLTVSKKVSREAQGVDAKLFSPAGIAGL